MLQFKLKISHKECFSGQITHSIECNGKHAGSLYDNRKCEDQKDNFVFLPQTSRIAGEFRIGDDKGDKEYLTYAKNVRGNDLAEVLDKVRTWGEAVEARVEELHSDFRKVLDAIPDRPFTASKEAQHYEGVSAKVLKGSDHSFTIKLTWAELAKLYGSSYSECSEYQVTDCGVRDQSYGLKWTYFRNSPTIQCISYSGTGFLSIERSADHIGASA